MRAHNPKNGEIWETKSGNIVLIVSSFTKSSITDNHTYETISFVWLDPIDREYVSTVYLDQLSHKLNMTIVEWAALMHQFAHNLTPELPQ